MVFGIAYKVLYGLAIPMLSRTGPLEPALRRAYRAVTQRPPSMERLPCPLNVEGYLLWFDSSVPSFTVRGIAMGTYERGTVALLRRTLAGGMTVVDVGGHIGYYSVLAASLVGPEGRVTTFEPDPRNRQVLERNIADNALDQVVRVVPKGLGAEEGRVALHRYCADSGSSSMYRRGAASAGSVLVDVTTLDAWAGSEGWPGIDVVKIDVEGAEGSVLAGMTEVVRRNPVMALILEFNAEALGESDVDGEQLMARLHDLGFEAIDVIEDGELRPIWGPRSVSELVRISRWVPVNLYCRRHR